MALRFTPPPSVRMWRREVVPGLSHRVGFTRFNAGPLIKLKKEPCQISQRILSEVQTALLIRAAKTIATS